MSKEKNIIAKNYEPKLSALSTAVVDDMLFIRGQFLYRTDWGIITNEYAPTSEFIGVCVSNMKLPKGVVGFIVNIYTKAVLLGKEIYDLQTDSVKAHLDEYAKSEGYSSVYEMQYHDIKLVR